MGKCILMCAGEFSPMNISVEDGDYVIAVDGGFRYLRELQIEPDLLLGDFDSMSEEDLAYFRKIRARHPEKIEQLPVEKDDTDTVAAVKRGLALGFKEFAIYGALGGRLDHAMANIQTLLWIKHHGGDGALLSPQMQIRVLEDEGYVFPDTFSGTFSLFALGEKASGISIHGTKYEAEQAVLTNDFPLGVSNETVDGVRSSITIQEGSVLLMMTDHYKNRHHGMLE